MRFISLRADRVSIRFRRPFPTAVGMWLEREAWIVRIRDADGRTGLGEAVLEPADGETAATILGVLLREAATTVATSGTLPTALDLEAHGRPGRALRAALDAAVRDLAGTPPGRLGDGGEGVGVNATIPILGPAASAEAALQAVEAGFRTLKLKGGAERETEVLTERVRAVRRAVGPDIRIRLDVNGAWDRPTAEDRLDALARLGLEYVEQPLPPDDLAGAATLRRLGVPIALDEGIDSVRAAREALASEAADVLVVKPARVGGPIVAAEIAALAAEHGVRVVVSTLFETGVGIAAALAVAAALPGGAMPGGADEPEGPDHGLATAGLLEHDLLLHALPVEDGRMWLPDEPGAGGLGISLDDRALERLRVESVEAAR